jgi:transcriptional regulator with XRE-family HTH domain
MANLHIGKKIKEVLRDSNLSVIEFAKKINRTRDPVYKIFAKESMDTELLQKISEVLQHDFFSYYSNTLSIVKEPGKAGYVKKDDLLASMGKDLLAMKQKLAEMDEKYEVLQKLSRFQEEKIIKLEKKKK